MTFSEARSEPVTMTRGMSQSVGISLRFSRSTLIKKIIQGTIYQIKVPDKNAEAELNKQKKASILSRKATDNTGNQQKNLRGEAAICVLFNDFIYF